MGGGASRSSESERDASETATNYVTGNATISFTATDDTTGITYTSDPGAQTNVGDPGVGHERNGVFV
jgi:hypothetical protein